MSRTRTKVKDYNPGSDPYKKEKRVTPVHEALGTVGSGEGLDVCNLYLAREDAVYLIRTLPLRPPPLGIVFFVPSHVSPVLVEL